MGFDEPGLALECVECRLGVGTTDVEALGRLGNCSFRRNLDFDSFGLVYYTYAMMHA